ncbi:MAG: methyl-accepting chemotaxis protein [Pseudomonadota bacterium]
MAISIGKKIFFGILTTTLVGLAAAVLIILLSRENSRLMSEGKAAGAALSVVHEAEVRLREKEPLADGSLSLSMTQRAAGLPPGVVGRVDTLVRDVERAALSGDEQRATAGLADASRLLAEEAERVRDALLVQCRTGQWMGLAVGATAMALGLLLSIILSRQTVSPLYRIIDGLKEGSRQTASASSQVATAAQGVAKGASDQAASLQETASAIEELEGMIKQNANNAAEANRLMEATRQVVGKAKESMDQMTVSMTEISRSGQEIEKIIKHIDEIAFQTNLLALNAAVEAARAGEAGMGFAVVADEVRNLAQRASQAAASTADLIGGAIRTIREGGSLVERARQTFDEVAHSSVEVRKLIEEIAAGSQEQAMGIEQLNSAVLQVDGVTQANAASAEEAASASEELTAQAASIERIVSDLREVVGLPRGSASNWAPVALGEPMMSGIPSLSAPASPPMARKAETAAALPSSKRKAAEELIPFDDPSSFQDF